MCDVGAGGQAVGDYNYYVHHVTIDSAVHTGINGYGKCWFDSNYIMVDAHNDKYSYPSGGVCYGADNAYGIGLSPEDGLDCRIVGNVIRSGVEYEGGRGIYIDNARASSAGRRRQPRRHHRRLRWRSPTTMWWFITGNRIITITTARFSRCAPAIRSRM